MEICITIFDKCFCSQTVVSNSLPCTSRDLHTTVPRHNATVVPFKLSDIGEGIAEVTIKEWYVSSDST